MDELYDNLTFAISDILGCEENDDFCQAITNWQFNINYYFKDKINSLRDNQTLRDAYNSFMTIPVNGNYLKIIERVENSLQFLVPYESDFFNPNT